MGDIADFINNQWDDYWMFEPFGQGAWKYNQDIFCRYCKRGPYDWVFTDHGWRLQTQKRQLIHKCEAYLKQSERRTKMEETKVPHLFYIAGVQHHRIKDVLGELKEDDRLVLRLEPTNKFDPNAVRIEYAGMEGEVMLGYVPRKFSSEVSAMLEVGKSLECVLTVLDKNAKPWEMAFVEIREV